MTKETELLRLEQFVEKMLQKFSMLKKERDGLLQRVAEKENLVADYEKILTERDDALEEKEGIINARDEKIRELETQLSENKNERNEISNRVSSIVEQIESWELGLDEETGEQEDQSVSHQEKEGQAVEGRIQQDLF